MLFIFVVSLIILLADTLCLAEPVCYENHFTRPPPLPSDCDFAIAHIPFAAIGQLQMPGQLVSSSGAFIPDATFRHKSCVIVLRAFFLEISSERFERHDVLAMRENTLFQCWRELKRLAEDIQLQCVEYGRQGYAGEPFQHLQHGRLYASIQGFPEEEHSYSNATIARKRRLMAKGHLYQNGMDDMDKRTRVDVEESWGTNPYGRTTYDI